MKSKDNDQPIPRDVAFQLCEEIRKEKARKWFTQCWGCVKFSKNDPAKMCFHGQPDYRGCKLINERYSQGKSR
jgi:hypothetical protein